MHIITTEYNAASEVTDYYDPDFDYSYSRDQLGRLTSETQSITGLTPTVVFASIYDSASNRTSLSATIGGTADFKNDSTFDALNRLTRIDQVGQGGGNTVATKRVDFAYNAINQFTQISRFQATNGTQNVANTYFTFDNQI